MKNNRLQNMDVTVAWNYLVNSGFDVLGIGATV